MKNIFLFIGICIFTIVQSFASEDIYNTFEGVREEGGFSSPSLRDVTDLDPGGRNLNHKEIEDLITSTSLISLRRLNLRNQPLVNDDFIARLSKNPTFSRIKILILSGTDITDEAISSIATSPHLGSIRELPSISGKYGVPYSEVAVYTKDTGVKDRTERTTFEFHIVYRPSKPSYPWGPDDDAIKFVKIQDW
ncbi:MAG: hypothetical protein K2Y18_02270 [Alphaproteobacteria bacterium]|jgi:hypothetical protein|nr:hypothetical protein [Alphaproteobacteria bacterium]